MPRHSPDRQTLGHVLRALREEDGLSQEKLGFRARLHRNYVGSAERGERNIGFDAIARWLDALDVSWARFGDALDRAAAAGRWPERKVAERHQRYGPAEGGPRSPRK